MRMTSLFKSARKQPFIRMFTRKRNNNGAMWASLIGLGISAVMFGLNKGQNKGQNKGANVPIPNGQSTGTMGSIQNLLQNNPFKASPSTMNDAAITEFSEELISKALQNNKPNQ